MLYTALGQGGAFVALMFFGVVAALIVEPFYALSKGLAIASGKSYPLPKNESINAAKVPALMLGRAQASASTAPINAASKTPVRKRVVIVFICDILVCAVALCVFWWALVWCNFGELRLFCLAGFTLGWWLEKLIFSKTVVFLLCKGYNIFIKFFKIPGGKRCKKRTQKASLNNTKAL